MIYLLVIVAELCLLFLLSRAVERGLSGLFLSWTGGSSKTSMWLMALLFLPGTFLHELSHLVMARLLLVKAGGLTIFPKMASNRIVMGSVLIWPTDRVRRLLIGIAPGIVGLVVMLGALWFVEIHHLWQSWPWAIGVGYLVFQIGNSLFSSPVDLEGALGLFVFVGIAVGVFYWLGVRPSLEWVVPLLDQYQVVLSHAMWLLLVPIGLDAIGIVLVWVLSPGHGG
jgi:hypothetical protein